MIELRHLSKIFPQKEGNLTALSDVSLHIPAGKIMGIIGESGAGKSTLIRCVNLLERPTSGEVYVNGSNMLELTPAELSKVRRNIGMIFQHFNLLSSRTVVQNVAFPLELVGTPKKEVQQRVTELLELVGLSDKANEYPANLSGGQKQRVAIARTLANNPQVLLCDEATSALDPATTRSILSLLKEINRKLQITTLLITHEMEVVKEICDEVAVLSRGRLIEQGTIAEIFSHPAEELTRRFIASSIQLQVPYDYSERLTETPSGQGHLLITLEISGQSMANAALSDVMNLFDTKSNIVCAQMDYAGGVKFGVMLIELIGTVENEQQAVAYLKEKNIKVEVLGYV